MIEKFRNLFKNNVFSISVSTKDWMKRAAIRALKTMAQTAVSLLTVGTAITEVDWFTVLCVSLTAGVASILTSIAGIPEVPEVPEVPEESEGELK